MANKDIKTPLKAWRSKQGLSQTEAGDLIGITQEHWSRIEHRLAGASPKIARKLANLTGEPFESFLGFGDHETAGTRS